MSGVGEVEEEGGIKFMPFSLAGGQVWMGVWMRGMLFSLAGGQVVSLLQSDEMAVHNNKHGKTGWHYPRDGINYRNLIIFVSSEEREIGHFEEEGNFVEDKVSKDDKDAWLESAEVVSDKVGLLLFMTHQRIIREDEPS